MTNWTATPLNGEQRPAHRLIRIRPGKPASGIITSLNLIGCYVHYWRGRTTPCQESKCPACKENQAARWYGWFSLWSPKTHEHVIAEITSACVDAFAAYALTHGQLRGAKVTLARATAKQNARLIAILEESAISPDILPPPLDVQTTLEKMWETHHTTTTPPPRTPQLADRDEYLHQCRPSGNGHEA